MERFTSNLPLQISPTRASYRVMILRKALLCCAVFLSLTWLTACGDTDQDQTLTNERFGFAYTLPEAYELSIDKPTRVEISGPDAGKDAITPLITIIVESYPELLEDNGSGQTNRPIDLNTYIIAMVQQRKAFFKENNLNIIGHQFETLHQHDIAWIEYTYTITEESKQKEQPPKIYEFHTREYFLIRPGTAYTYTLGFTFAKGTFKQHQTTVTHFLEHFHLIELSD